MRYLWLILLLAGLWFVTSAATERGLLPSGHGIGRVPEAVVGVGLIVYAIFRFRRQQR